MQHLPQASKNIHIADKTDMETLDQFDREPLVTLELSPEQCPDFLIDRTTGQFSPRIKSIRINGAQWNLLPGKNKVPQSVYEFFMEAEKNRRQAAQPIRARCLGQLY